jgi:hypothetical protein
MATESSANVATRRRATAGQDRIGNPSTISHLEENLSAADLQLPRAAVEALNAIRGTAARAD